MMKQFTCHTPETVAVAWAISNTDSISPGLVTARTDGKVTFAVAEADVVDTLCILKDFDSVTRIDFND